MKIYECKRCHKKFYKLYNFVRHENRKNKCKKNIISKMDDITKNNLNIESTHVNSNKSIVDQNNFDLNSNSFELNLIDFIKIQLKNKYYDEDGNIRTKRPPIQGIVAELLNMENKNNVKQEIDKYKCQYCNKLFSTNSNLLKHIRISCKEKNKLIETIEILQKEKKELQNKLIEQSNKLKEITEEEKENRKTIRNALPTMMTCIMEDYAANFKKCTE